MANLKQIGVKESNGDVTFGVARPYWPNLTLRQFQQPGNRLYHRNDTK
jgi:hypothetical protein